MQANSTGYSLLQIKPKQVNKTHCKLFGRVISQTLGKLIKIIIKIISIFILKDYTIIQQTRAVKKPYLTCMELEMYFLIVLYSFKIELYFYSFMILNFMYFDSDLQKFIVLFDIQTDRQTDGHNSPIRISRSTKEFWKTTFRII